jgi:hypothetical protein
MLTIKDLSMSKEMDTEALATVRGGTGFPLVDFQNSFNMYDIWNSLDYRPDYSVDELTQTNEGIVSASGNFGSVVLPQLSQSNFGING